MSTEAFNTMRKNLVESVTGSALDWLAYMGADAALAAIPDTNPPRYVVAGTLADIVKLLPATETIHPPLTAPAPLTDELIQRFASWIMINRPKHHIDHACARCVPHGDMVIDGFNCTYHEAVDIVGGIMPAAAKAAPAAPVQTSTLVPKWAGYFHSYQDWVNKAQSRLASPDHRRAICVDAKGRRCAIGKDFMLARDEGAFPVRYFWECELAVPVQAEQAQAEPVAWMDPSAGCVMDAFLWQKDATNPQYHVPVYAAPVAAVSAQAEQAAAVRAAYEKAALACENERVEDACHASDSTYNSAITHCAAAIRALRAQSTATSNDTGALGDTGGEK